MKWFGNYCLGIKNPVAQWAILILLICVMAGVISLLSIKNPERSPWEYQETLILKSIILIDGQPAFLLFENSSIVMLLSEEGEMALKPGEEYDLYKHKETGELRIVMGGSGEPVPVAKENVLI